MHEAPGDPGELDDELEDYEDDIATLDTDVQALIDALRDRTDATLRMAIRYSGEEYDAVFIRDDLRERYSDAELEDRIERLVFKGHGDPPRETELYDFGRLDAAMRWYDGVIVAHFPVREWSGLVFTFDRQESPIVDLAQKFLED